MAVKLYDENGDEVIEVEDTEGLAEKLQASAEAEEAKKKLEELETEHNQLKEKYAGLENKDFNFRQFEKASEEEKAKLMEKMTEIEKASVQKITELSAQIESGNKEAQENMKSKVIESLAAGDEELKKELEQAYEKSLEFGGQPKTADDVITRMKEAYRYVKGAMPPVNPLNSFSPTTPVFEKKTERFTDTEKGKNILHQINPELYPLEDNK